MILGFAHPCLVVENADAVKDFYCDMFGFNVIGQESWSNQPMIDIAINVPGSNVNGYMLAGHNCFLEIHQYNTPAASTDGPQSLSANEKGIRHLAFLVDDCFAESIRFEKLGGSIFSEPVEMSPGVHAVYGRDPFGHIIELFEPVSDDEKLTALPGISHLQQY